MSKLTSKQRKKLPSSVFAEPGKRKYPLDTKNRAKNALARVSQHGSPAEKAAVRRKVHGKFPGIAVSGLKKTASKKKGSRKRAISKR
jgi:hypothetical protein